MPTEKDARSFADEWVRAWNAHDLDAILSHYADDVVLVSPVAAALLGRPAGRVEGKAALRAYFAKGLDAYPQLSFQLVDVLTGLSSVVLYYVNQKGTKTGECMAFGSDGKVSSVIAHYGG